MADLQTGDTIAERFELLEELGAGGAGVVFRARDLQSGEEVALKLLLEVGATDDEERKRFQREIELIERLRDPHTVRLVDSGFVETTPYMALELVEGETLGHILKARGALPPALTRAIFVQIVSAVAEAHEWGIVHRDLKPQNIMVAWDGETPHVKVLDFGIAGLEEGFQELGDHESITVAGNAAARGTPQYMAPEQCMAFGKPVVPSDIYALGLILLECLTGETAVSGGSVSSIFFKQITVPVEIPEDIRTGAFGPIIERAVEKEAKDRYPKAGSMLADLQRVSEDATELRPHDDETMPTVASDVSSLLGELAVAAGVSRDEMYTSPPRLEPAPQPPSSPSPTPSGASPVLPLALVAGAAVAILILVVVLLL